MIAALLKGSNVLDLKFVIENRARVLERLAARGSSLEQVLAWPGLGRAA